jgi:hypothetical protein
MQFAVEDSRALYQDYENYNTSETPHKAKHPTQEHWKLYNAAYRLSSLTSRKRHLCADYEWLFQLSSGSLSARP